MSANRPFVLVHGAWHGGWCWRDVAAALRAAGHLVFTPTLTGLGERAHLIAPEINLSTHIQDIAAVIEREELDNVILVGHSYAGWVIAGVAERLAGRLAHLIYLDASIPVSGKAFFEAMGGGETGDPRQHAENGYTLPPPPATWFGIDDADADKAAWVARHLTPHPLATLTERLDLPKGGGQGIEHSFILCTRPSGTDFSRDADRARAAGWRVTEIDSGHDAMVTAPDALASLLHELA